MEHPCSQSVRQTLGTESGDVVLGDNHGVQTDVLCCCRPYSRPGGCGRALVVTPKTCLCPGCHMSGRQSVLTSRAGARDWWGLGRGPGVWGRLATAAVLANPQRSRGGALGPRTLSGRASPASRVPMLDLWGIPVRVLALRHTGRNPEGQVTAYMRQVDQRGRGRTREQHPRGYYRSVTWKGEVMCEGGITKARPGHSLGATKGRPQGGGAACARRRFQRGVSL